LWVISVELELLFFFSIEHRGRAKKTTISPATRARSWTLAAGIDIKTDQLNSECVR
jgi:hypothetical protein